MIAPSIRSAQLVIPCSDFRATLDFFVERLGFRIDAIFPADAPSTAVISGHGVRLHLERAYDGAAPSRLRLICDLSALLAGTPRKFEAPNGMTIELVDANSPIEVPDGQQEFVISRLDETQAWEAGRATMQYRDLIPSRLGGRFVASHIRLPEGGPVPDYVHYHRVRFQMIFCKEGWVKVVYEDQGPPFVLHAGDCVLQPPEIRHRVLEASPGLEVVEIGCPAMHETFADHELTLPNDKFEPNRFFGVQRFVRHTAKYARWSPWKIAGVEACDTGVAAATAGLAGAKVIRSAGEHSGTISHNGEFLFFFVLRGDLVLRSHAFGTHPLRQDASCAIPAGAEFQLSAKPGLEMLEIALPAPQTASLIKPND
jgi:quercetin dioxygenase-like cupin family protein